MNISSNLIKHAFVASLFLAPQFLRAETALDAVSDKSFEKIMTGVESDIEKGRLQERTLRALDVLVKHGADELSRAGFETEAKNWLDSWKGNVFAKDLGDHQALVNWLADYYSWLEKRLGSKIMELSGLTDIKIFNYGIPVAFHVNGWKGDDWDSVEYKKHFVPLAGAITYWTCDIACSMAAPPLVGYGCGTMAKVPRYAMVKWIAPGLSDRVYKKFRKN